MAQKNAHLKNLEAEVEEIKALVKEAAQRMKLFVKEAAASSAQLTRMRQKNGNKDDDGGDKGDSDVREGKGDDDEEEAISTVK